MTATLLSRPDPPAASFIGVGDVQVTEQMRLNVADVLASQWLSPGKWCTEFERQWAALHQQRYAVFVNSGTSALHIGLLAMKEKYGWHDGDGVIVPALTFVASVNTIIQAGLRPVFADIDPYYGIDPRSVPFSGAVAIMPVHLNGQQCNMPDVRAYASARRLRVIEDSCECVGIPSSSDVTCYSTYAAHHVTTGVGGFACTNDPDVAALLRSLANHGRDGIYFDSAASAEQLVTRRFRFERHGFSYRASEFEAAVGCAQLLDLRRSLRRRRDVAGRFFEALEGLPLVLPRARPTSDWWPMFYPVLSDHRDELSLWLEEHGIETRPFLPLVDQPVYRGMIDPEAFPGARRVSEQGMYWGCHPGMSDDDVDRVIAVVRDFYRRR